MKKANTFPIKRIAIFFSIILFFPGFLVPKAIGDTHIWDNGGGDGLWHTAVNWDNDQIPADGDDVQIPSTAPNPNVTYSSSSGTTSLNSIDTDGTLNVTGGTLNIAAASTGSTGTLNLSSGTANFNDATSIATLNFSNGTLGGTGTVTVSTSFAWSGGTMSGSGITTIGSGVTNGTISGDFWPDDTSQPCISDPYLSFFLNYGDGDLDLAEGGRVGTIQC